MTLREGTLLQNGKYRIVRILTQDDTVINYKATCKMVCDGSLGKVETEVDVIIKEFFLKHYCQRNKSGEAIITDQNNSKLVEGSKMSFKEMATNMASMNAAGGNAQITDIFEENNTVYYVTPISSGTPSDHRSEYHNVPAMPANEQPRVTVTPPEPAEVGYGYENSNNGKKKAWLIAALAGLLIAGGAALYFLLPRGEETVEVGEEVTEAVTEEPSDATNTISEEARDQVAKDVEEINNNLPNAVNDHIIMKSAVYDKESNVLSITYDVTNNSDLQEQKENIRKGMLNGLKSNDNTGKHFREALITVKEYFKMNGTIIDQFVLTPEDYSKIKI